MSKLLRLRETLRPIIFDGELEDGGLGIVSKVAFAAKRAMQTSICGAWLYDFTTQQPQRGVPMAKKRDIVINSIAKQKFKNVIDLAQFKVDRESARIMNGKALRQTLRWLPTAKELAAPDSGVAKMLCITGADGRTFFAIASEASGFFGAESADGTRSSLGALEWFRVADSPSKAPVVIRVADLHAIVADGIGRPVPASPISTVRHMVKEPVPLN